VLRGRRGNGKLVSQRLVVLHSSSEHTHFERQEAFTPGWVAYLPAGVDL
jgi:hypothetical protein